MATAPSSQAVVAFYTLKIWYRFKHDHSTVAEIYHQPDPQKKVKDLIREGGFWFGPYWVPLHCITAIEQIEETKPTPRSTDAVAES